MDEIKADRLPVSAAYELSRLPEEEQLAAYTGLHEDKPAKAQKPRRQTGTAGAGRCVPVEHTDLACRQRRPSGTDDLPPVQQRTTPSCSSLPRLLRYEPEQLACDLKALAARH